MSCGQWAQGHLRMTERRSLWQHVADNAPFWTRSKTAFRFNINSVLDQPSLGLFIFSPSEAPFLQSLLTIIIKIQNLQRPWPKNALFFPNILGLERGTLVSFPKLFETAWTADEAALYKCNRGATKFRNFQRPWLTCNRQCTVLNQVPECLQI